MFKRLPEILKVILDSKLHELTKVFLFLVTLIGIIIIINNLKGESHKNDEIQYYVRNQSDTLRAISAEQRKQSAEQADLKVDMKKGFDSTHRAIHMNTFEIEQVKRNQRIIIQETSSDTKKKIEESEIHHEQDREFIKSLMPDVAPKKSEVLKLDYPEITNGTYKADTLQHERKGIFGAIAEFFKDKIL